MDKEFYFPSPPPFIFLNDPTIQKTIDDERKEENTFAHTARLVQVENKNTYLIDHFEIGEGMKVFYKDPNGQKFPFPRKGFAFPEAVASLNKVKRMIMEIASLAIKPHFFISWFLILISSKKLEIIEKLLSIFNKFSYPLVSKYLLQPVVMTELSSEFQGIVHALLLRLGITIPTSARIAQTAGVILEFDSAYRFRLEDLFSETTKEKLTTNPYKECNRLFKIYCARERMAVVKVKFVKIFRLISLPLLIPSIKKAFIQAIKHSEFARLQYDEIDTYWCKLRSDDDYLYGGKTHKERMGDLSLPGGVQMVIES